jgi:SAM-dependent methyltransferase
MEKPEVNEINTKIENENFPEFESSLWKKDYWDNFYSQEINQFKNNSSLIGEIWFGKQVQKKILNYINNKYSQNKSVKILDIGCGNASLLLKLSKLGFAKGLHGMDYSEKSLELAREIISDKSLKYPDIGAITLFQDDLKLPKNENLELGFTNFDLIHDKGTFDAFMSSKTNNSEEYIKYIISISRKYSNNSVFIITSCNFSKSELISFFTQPYFVLQSEIPHKTFTYGGQIGQPVTTLIYEIVNI